jgi:hypothetical protein
LQSVTPEVNVREFVKTPTLSSQPSPVDQQPCTGFNTSLNSPHSSPESPRPEIGKEAKHPREDCMVIKGSKCCAKKTLDFEESTRCEPTPSTTKSKKVKL